MPNLPTFKYWPADLIARSTRELVTCYERGFQGAYKDHEADEQLMDSMEFKTFGDVAHENDMAGDGAGKLSLAYECAVRLNPREFPGLAQRTGCCVSRTVVNAFTCAYGYEVWHGLPDGVKRKVLAGDRSGVHRKYKGGKAEAWPKVPYPDHQTFDHVVIYGERGHRGQGANCGTLAWAAKDKTGLLPRGVHDIPDYGEYDCSKYDDNKAARSGPRMKQAIRDYVNKHRVREVTQITDIEELRDALANNYGIVMCSGYATNSRRPTIRDSKGNDCAGAQTWRGSWAHAQAWTAIDDREWCNEKYGGPLVLTQNSWGAGWNSGPTRIYDTDKHIPPCSYWMKPRDVRSIIRGGGVYAVSNIVGFPRRPVIVEFW